MPQARLTQEVHRLFEQAKVDDAHFQDIDGVFENHSTWMRWLRMMIVDLQQKVASITMHAIENDQGLKRSLAMHDAELKDKLKAFEAVVTGQGATIGDVRDAAASGLQGMDSKYGQALSTMEKAVQNIRDEVPVRLTELNANMTDMNNMLRAGSMRWRRGYRCRATRPRRQQALRCQAASRLPRHFLSVRLPTPPH